MVKRNPESGTWKLVVLCGVTGITCAGARADDWPQWRGPGRNAVSTETGLLRSWPTGGPPLAWRTSGIGSGYSSLVVGEGRLFTMGRRSSGEHQSDCLVTALDAATGERLWSRKIGETGRHPSSTPTVDGEHLYALDPDGELVCLRAVTGEIVWRRDFVADFAGRMMSGRGYGESPLIDGERLLCTPGGEDAALVALDKRTGAILWKAKLPPLGPAGKDGAGFSSMVVTEAAGRRQYVQLMGRGLVGVDARDGRFLWSYNAIANDTANIPTPVVHNEFVFAANGYTAGSVLLRLLADGPRDGERPGVKIEVVYALTGSQFQNHHGGVVLVGDYLYGGHGNNNGLPTCVEFQTGRVMWKRRGPGVGSAAVVAADGHLYFRYQNGLVALIEASARGYQVNGTFEVPGAGGDSWAHPVVAQGRLYLREQDELWVYDLRAGARDSALPAPTTPASATSVTDAELRAKLTALRNLDVSIDRFSPAESAPRTLRVVLSNAHVSSQGTISAQVLEALRDLAQPFFLSLAGTRVTDAGLEALSGMPLVGLDLELCPRLTDAGLDGVRPLTDLRTLVLTGTAITHVGLRPIAMNSKLVELDLELCDGITDDACQTLGAMRQLKRLNLKKSGFEPRRITDSGLERLRELVHLEGLNLYGNKVTDQGLVTLQRMPSLRELNLSLLPITDAGLRQLESLGALEHLELLYSEGFAGPLLTNAGMEFLTPLRNLHMLNLTGAKLTDVGLEELRGLQKLQTLHLARTRVSEQGVRALQEAVPGCRIVQ